MRVENELRRKFPHFLHKTRATYSKSRNALLFWASKTDDATIVFLLPSFVCFLPFVVTHVRGSPSPAHLKGRTPS